MPEIIGVNTREVWDWRLSTASPTLYNRGEFWRITLKDNTTGKEVYEHITDIPCTKGDTYDQNKIAKCYEHLKEIRAQYSRPNIEALKPEVAKINAINAGLHEALRGASVDEGRVIFAKYKSDLNLLGRL